MQPPRDSEKAAPITKAAHSTANRTNTRNQRTEQMVTQGPAGRCPIVVGTIEVTLASLVAGHRIRNPTGEHVRVNIGDTRHVLYNELELIVSACWDAALIEVIGADPFEVTSTVDYLRRRLADVVPW